MRSLALAILLVASVAEARKYEIVVIPDTQRQTLIEPALTDRQIDWIIGYQPDVVFHVGDLVEHPDDIEQWRTISEQVARLDTAGIPFVSAVGNHDQNPVGNPDRSTLNYLRYFGPSRYAHTRWYTGFHEDGDMQAGRLGHLVWATTEYERRGGLAATWLESFLSSNPNKVRLGVVHYPLSPDGEHLAPDGRAVAGMFHIVFGGHVHTGQLKPPTRGCLAERKRDRGTLFIVHNCQSDERHGSGWLRLYTLRTRRRTISATTYTPALETFKVDAENAFTEPY